METLLKEAKSILTPQKTGFLAAGPYPFTHTLSAYLGCGFGQTTCGLYCYAQFLPSWFFRSLTTAWGGAVQVKTNAARLLEEALEAMRPAARRRLRILMSGSTDPFQPLERQYQLTRQCLEVFARYPELDLLLVQTRSPLAERDVPLLREIPYAWLSVTIETDDQVYLRSLKGGPPLSQRWELVRSASDAGIHTQIAVSPCLAYSGVETFGQRLLQSGAQRLIVDSLIAGDGADGQRTARSPFAKVEPDWAKTAHAQRLYHYLRKKTEGTGIAVGWSSAGFSGIPPRRLTLPRSLCSIFFELKPLRKAAASRQRGLASRDIGSERLGVCAKASNFPFLPLPAPQDRVLPLCSLFYVGCALLCVGVRTGTCLLGDMLHLTQSC